MGVWFDNEHDSAKFMARVTGHILQELAKYENWDLANAVLNHGTDNGFSFNETRAARFEAIIAPIDDGWTGALYGEIMLEVQTALRDRLNSEAMADKPLTAAFILKHLVAALVEYDLMWAVDKARACEPDPDLRELMDIGKALVDMWITETKALEQGE